MSTDDTTANSTESPGADLQPEHTTARPDAGRTERPATDQPTDNTTDPGADPPDTEQPTEDTTDDGDAKLRREASRYRRQLRETETERDGLRTRVEAMQRAEVERLAAKDLATPTDLWVLGAVLGDLLDDNGNVDQAKVNDATAKILTDRPGWRRITHPNFDGGVRTAAPNTGPTWHDALKAKP